LPSRRRVGSNIHGDDEKAKQNVGVSHDFILAEVMDPGALRNPNSQLSYLFL
jgi:hypothetical protein